MLQGSVLHNNHGGASVKGGHGDVVGISWKPLMRTNEDPCLVVTCAHQVVVYKPGESRRVHQWSFKPSASQVFSHAAVFVPQSSRYMAVQSGSSLVSWREIDRDVKRPTSVKAEEKVQAVHGCPQLGDFFVVVLVTGVVMLYQGNLEALARCDGKGTTDRGDSASKGDEGAYSNVLWSGLLGENIFVLEKREGTTCINTFHMSVPKSCRGQSSTSGSSRQAASVTTETSDLAVRASVTLVSSHVLGKPSSPAESGVGGNTNERTCACSAAILFGAKSGVILVAWRSPRGPLWTKVTVSASGVREELSRPADMGRSAPTTVPNSPTCGASGGDGHDLDKAACRSKGERGKNHELVDAANGGEESRRSPTVAAAGGGRLFVHSGGTNPRLSSWDATYGVLLDEGEAPEYQLGETTAVQGNTSGAKAVTMVVSDDGAQLALAVGEQVIWCALPVMGPGTLASLLRRKRPTTDIALAIDAGEAMTQTQRGLFPSVDLMRSTSATQLLDRTGITETRKWEIAVLDPLRRRESEVIHALEEATRRRDAEAFMRIIQHGEGGLKAPEKPAQTRSAEVGSITCVKSTGDEAGGAPSPGEQEAKKRQRDACQGMKILPRILSTAVELCLTNPGANLWCALRMLIQSGGISARHHRGLVPVIIDHGPPDLLEEVMLHVPDLPEADAVRILRHFLLQAAAVVKRPKDLLRLSALPPSSGVKTVEDEPPAKRSKKPSKSPRSASDTRTKSSKQGDRSRGRVMEEQMRSNSGMGNEPKFLDKANKLAKNSPANVTDKARSKHESLRPRSNGNLEQWHDKPNPYKGTNGVLVNGHHHCPEINTGIKLETTVGISNEGVVGDAEAMVAKVKKGAKADSSTKERPRKRDMVERATVRAERGVRVALTLPYNEAFLRSALVGLGHVEVVIVLKILTRIFLEDPCHGASVREMRDFPGPSSDAVLGWISALMDAHFTRLAIGGSLDTSVSSALGVLRQAATHQAEACEVLSEVRSLTDEARRRHAALQEEIRRRPDEYMYSVQKLYL